MKSGSEQRRWLKMRKKVAAPLLEACHDLGEEAEITGVAINKRVGDVLIANAAKSLVGPTPEGLEHLGVLMLQYPGSARLI